MSDVHGELDLFKKMIEKIDLRDSDTLYVLGDLIDRGEKSIDTLIFAMNHPNVEFIIGNHEDMMCSIYTGNVAFFKNWIRECNGGAITLEQYHSLEEKEQLEIENFLKEAPLYKLVEVKGKKFLLVHAGIQALTELDLEKALESQSRRDIIWIRGEFTKTPCRKDVTVIFGHTFTESLCEEHRIWYSYIEEGGKIHNDKIGIDCGSYESKKLGCLRLDDMKEFYVS
ncbi:MAG: metallophosphoesterase [Romboutsia sp.]